MHRTVAGAVLALSVAACADSSRSAAGPTPSKLNPLVSGTLPRVSQPIDVTADAFADNEESAGISPDGALLAASWNDFDFNDGCGFSFSTHGGKSWAPRTFVPGLTQFTNDPAIPGTGSFNIAGDPAVAFNPRFGTFVVVCQAFVGTSANVKINLLATTFDPAKADPNANENASYVGVQNPWTPPVAVATGLSNGTQKGSNGQFPDHEAVTVDASTGRIYVAWAEFSGFGRSPIDLAFSDDNGVHWTGPIRVSDVGHKFDQDAHPIVGPDGTVYVSFITAPNEVSLANNFAAIAASHDGGFSFGPTQIVAPVISPVPGRLPNSNYRVFSDVVSTVSPKNIVTVVWNDRRNGHSNIYSRHNLVPGDLTAWSEPVPVAPSDKEQFFPWMVSTPSGRLDLVFYDRTPDPANTLNFATYAASFDDGASWGITPATRTGFDGDRFQACLAFVQPSTCGVFFLGDYIGVVSTDAAVHLLYTFNGPQAQDVFDTNIAF